MIRWMTLGLLLWGWAAGGWGAVTLTSFTVENVNGQGAMGGVGDQFRVSWTGVSDGGSYNYSLVGLSRPSNYTQTSGYENCLFPQPCGSATDESKWTPEGNRTLSLAFSSTNSIQFVGIIIYRWDGAIMARAHAPLFWNLTIASTETPADMEATTGQLNCPSCAPGTPFDFTVKAKYTGSGQFWGGNDAPFRVGVYRCDGAKATKQAIVNECALLCKKDVTKFFPPTTASGVEQTIVVSEGCTAPQSAGTLYGVVDDLGTSFGNDRGETGLEGYKKRWNDYKPDNDFQGTPLVYCQDQADAFTNVWPANNSMVGLIPPVLEWTRSADATGYEVYINNVKAADVAQPASGNVTYVATGVGAGQGNIPWYVKAKKAEAGCWRDGDRWTFSTAAGPASAARKYYVSTIARAAGQAGSNWKTDLRVLNPGTAGTVKYALKFLGRTLYDEAGAGVEKVHDNLVENGFRMGAGAGPLVVEADGELRLTSRTYNDQSTGTFGQFIGAMGEGDLLGQNQTGYLLLLNNGGTLNPPVGYRTNVGFSEVTGAGPATVTMEAFDETGKSLGTTTQTAGALQNIQTQISNWIPGANKERMVVKVTVAGSGKGLAYASVTDNKTNDAIYVPAQRAEGVAGEGRQMIAVISKAPGASGSNWRSDVGLLNVSGSPQTVALNYRKQGQETNPVPQTVLLADKQYKFLGDIVGGGCSA